jgi:hypothetical protein
LLRAISAGYKLAGDGYDTHVRMALERQFGFLPGPVNQPIEAIRGERTEWARKIQFPLHPCRSGVRNH